MRTDDAPDLHSTSTIEQRIFDVLAYHDGVAVSIDTLYAELNIAHRSVQKALQRLLIDRIIRPVETTGGRTYERVPGARRPTDERGQRKHIQRAA